MKQVEIKELKTDDLVERIGAEVAKYNQTKANHAITPLENPSLIKEARRNIARMKTELRKRELENNK
ncbi:MAG: 50S ribosomal protein L29 [Prevotella sp.]|nr:50S ribosomal protein L29 [Candidatus Equicola faecalis]MDO4819892.1 50S ribosomal protein L29 [Prevotella sp.]